MKYYIIIVMFDISGFVNWFRKNFSKRDLFYTALLLVTYLATRLINLDKFPIFTDEGIYIHWSKIAWKDAAWRFISLTDGKQPLHTWGMIPFLKIFSPNLLLGGRMFSVLSGLIALKGVFSLSYYLWGKKTAFIASLFYIFTPMFLFYDRMALADSAVNAGFIWILFGSILLIRTLRMDVALAFGLAAGTAMLTKSSSQMFVALSGLAPVLAFKKKSFIKNSFSFYVLFVFAYVLALVIYNVQRLSPYLQYVDQKNGTFVLTFKEFFAAPFSLVISNLPLIPWYVFSEMGYALGVIGVVGLFFLIKKDWRLGLYLAAWLLFPYVAISFFAKVIFPRYLIFFATLLTLTAAYLISSTKNKTVKVLCFTFYALSVGYFNYAILFDNQKIPFPPVDRGQYIESVNAGYGIKDLIQYAREKSMDKPVILLAEGNFGVVGDMLESSIGIGEKISIRGFWPLNAKDLYDNQKELANNHVYVVYSHRKLSEIDSSWPLRLIKEYRRPFGDSSFTLLELTSAN